MCTTLPFENRVSSRIVETKDKVQRNDDECETSDKETKLNTI